MVFFIYFHLAFACTLNYNDIQMFSVFCLYNNVKPSSDCTWPSLLPYQAFLSFTQPFGLEFYVSEEI